MREEQKKKKKREKKTRKFVYWRLATEFDLSLQLSPQTDVP